MGNWLFYAGPENYLGADGERSLGTETVLWSGAPGGRKGDLAALYRRSLTKVSVEQLREMTGMTVQRAREVKRYSACMADRFWRPTSIQRLVQWLRCGTSMHD